MQLAVLPVLKRAPMLRFRHRTSVKSGSLSGEIRQEMYNVSCSSFFASSLSPMYGQRRAMWPAFLQQKQIGRPSWVLYGWFGLEFMTSSTERCEGWSPTDVICMAKQDEWQRCYLSVRYCQGHFDQGCHQKKKSIHLFRPKTWIFIHVAKSNEKFLKNPCFSMKMTFYFFFI